MKKQLPGWAVLLIITLVAGLALGVTYSLTKDPIAEQAVIQAENARKTVMPDAESFSALTLEEGSSMDWAYAGLKTVKGKQPPLTLADIDAISGATYTSKAVVDAINQAWEKYQAADDKTAAFSGEAEGFVSPVKVEATFADGAIASLTIGDARFAETEGLGSKALTEEFKSQFLGGEKVVGYVAQTTVQGFKGEVEVIAGLDPFLTLTGISVGGSNFSETAGLGAKSKDPEFTSQFAGKQAPVRVIKAGGTPGDSTVDAITAATITSNAVAGGVNTIANFVKTDLLGIAEAEMPARPDDSQVFGASVQGFHGPVYVEAAFDSAGKITYFAVGDEDFSETPEFGGHAQDVDFMYQFIGKAAPLTLSDIDALSGATITSTAVVNALNTAYDLSQGAEITVPETPVLPEKPADIQVYGASSQGFAGPVYVEAAFDEAGAITYISVGDGQFAETAGLGARALQPEFQAQFIGKTAPLALSDIDALAGATITSTAVVDALNSAYNASQGIVPEEEPEPEQAEKPEVTFKADADGFDSPVAVEAAFDGNTVTWISIGDGRFDETPGLGAKALEPAFAAQFIGKSVPLTLSDIDAIAGATFTSQAVVDALNKAYNKSLAAADAEPAPTEAPVPEAEKPEVTFKADADGFDSPVAVEAAFDGNTVTWISIGDGRFDETPGLGAKALEPAFAAQFIGKSVPLTLSDIDAIAGATFTSQAVVDALNKAYNKSLKAAEAPVTEEPVAEEPVVEAPVTEEPAEEPTREEPITEESAAEEPAGHTGEAIAFFTAIRVEADFDGDTLTVLNVLDKAVGSEAYAVSAQQEAMRNLFLGAPLPLDTKQSSAYAAAVAVAVNQAYGKTAEADAPAEGKPVYTGECILFFDRIVAEASFDGDTLSQVSVNKTPIGGGETTVYAWTLWTGLLGRKAPMDPAAYTLPGVDEATARAVIIAINDAYAKYQKDGVSAAETPEEQPAEQIAAQGAAICFFQRVIAVVLFDGDRVSQLLVYDAPVGQEETDLSPLQDQMSALFEGASVPMDTQQESAYASAVAIAINEAYQAYQSTLAGQQ